MGNKGVIQLLHQRLQQSRSQMHVWLELFMFSPAVLLVFLCASYLCRFIVLGSQEPKVIQPFLSKGQTKRQFLWSPDHIFGYILEFWFDVFPFSQPCC